MPRGYRCIVLAAVGWLVLAGASPTQKQPERAHTQKQIAQPARTQSDYAPYPNMNAKSCYQAKDHDAADLCAQWRAAVAAEKTSDSAWLANFIGAISAVLTFISIVLVIFALRQTERSLKIAQRERASATIRSIAAAEDTRLALEVATQNASAAIKLAETSEKSLQATQRAFLNVLPTAQFVLKEGRIIGLKINTRIENVGNTEARNLEISAGSKMTGGDLPPDFSYPVEKVTGRDYLIPRSPEGFAAPATTIFRNGDLEAFLSGRHVSFYWGEVVYQDIFDRRHHIKHSHHLVIINRNEDPIKTEIGFARDVRHNRVWTED